MSETKMDNFIVKGPRTVLWVLRFMKENGGTPIGRHARFKTDAGLKPDDAGVVMHASLCKILQIAATSDQLDASNLGSMELVCREVQMIEENYASRLNSKSGQLSEEHHLFTATRQSQGNVCMCPALREWMAEELKGEAAIHKERRKAREERELLRQPGAKKGAK